MNILANAWHALQACFTSIFGFLTAHPLLLGLAASVLAAWVILLLYTDRRDARVTAEDRRADDTAAAVMLWAAHEDAGSKAALDAAERYLTGRERTR